MLDRWTDRVPPWHGDLTTLREVNATDVYSLVTLFSDPAVTTYMAPPPPTLAKITRVVLPIHLWKARKNEYGASNPCKKLISAPLIREFFDVQVHRRDQPLEFRQGRDWCTM